MSLMCLPTISLSDTPSDSLKFSLLSQLHSLLLSSSFGSSFKMTSLRSNVISFQCRLPSNIHSLPPSRATQVLSWTEHVKYVQYDYEHVVYETIQTHFTATCLMFLMSHWCMRGHIVGFTRKKNTNTLQYLVLVLILQIIWMFFPGSKLESLCVCLYVNALRQLYLLWIEIELCRNRGRK